MTAGVAARRRSERGSAAVLGVTLLGLLLVVTTVCVGLAGVVLAHRRAQGAADLGALAGAGAIQHLRAPCPAAASLVRANGGRLTGCEVRGEVVRVRAEVVTVRIWGHVRHTSASARAGPVGDEGGGGLVPR